MRGGGSLGGRRGRVQSSQTDTSRFRSRDGRSCGLSPGKEATPNRACSPPRARRLCEAVYPGATSVTSTIPNDRWPLPAARPPSSWWVTVGCGVERLAAVQAAGPAVHIRLSDCLPGESPVGGAPPRALGAVVGGRWGVCTPSRCASVAQSLLPERCARARPLGLFGRVRWLAMQPFLREGWGGMRLDAPPRYPPNRWSALRKRSERIRGKRAFFRVPLSLSLEAGVRQSVHRMAIPC